VDEVLHIPELELDRGPDIVEAHDLGKGLNDLKAAFHAPQMIVGHLEDKKFVKKVAVDHGMEC
jgi:hypothetical protein